MLIPGRAIHLSIEWHNDHKLSILNVYAPNNPSAHPTFWKDLHQAWISNFLLKLDLLLGDFNITEDPINRTPAHLDNENVIEALRDLQHTLGLKDTWHHSNPTERLFTYMSNANSMSQLDRIYSQSTHEHSLSRWDHTHTSISTNHKMVLTPFIRKGRWTWPLGLMPVHDHNLTNKITKIGLELQRNLSALTEDRVTGNAQQLWEQFKTKISDEAKKKNSESSNHKNQPEDDHH
ncbi:hypothetical protein HYDPIDRAFT_169730 [Hydnomerulius pinastri MD-312]|uniref:Endonuclease/exonuclease/phosphatase domain-containing protein n=1 Tax=Hydnomerulius pinastri MD-312 TaxID=994086 RepID=A0A0C9W4Q8_9AGAM|nr:hypothetical protein HYDPIDRAFT_169730 [Hydnomerulius pinastri MD-312]